MVEEQTNVESNEDNNKINPILAEAKSLAERIEEGNKKSEELLKKQERLLAEQQLGGQLGGRVESKPHVETSKEYSEKVMRGDKNND